MPHRAPRKGKRRPIVARFNADNRELIEGTWKRVVSGAPITDPLQRNVADCIAWALTGFHQRVLRMFPHGLPIENDEWVLKVCKPATFFDDFCMRLGIQDICDTTGRGVARHMSLPPPNPPPGFGRTPDVIFLADKPPSSSS